MLVTVQTPASLKDICELTTSADMYMHLQETQILQADSPSCCCCAALSSSLFTKVPQPLSHPADNDAAAALAAVCATRLLTETLIAAPISAKSLGAAHHMPHRTQLCSTIARHSWKVPRKDTMLEPYACSVETKEPRPPSRAVQNCKPPLQAAHAEQPKRLHAETCTGTYATYHIILLGLLAASHL